MSLATRYRQFLNRPSSDLLSASANLHYLPTTTTINSADAIVKHFNAQNQVLRKKNEDFKNVVEGPNSICVETETTLEFNMGGGAYLPGIDDHLLADRSVTLPIVHIVNFNAEDKIQQVRVYWDMGSLLKTIEIIGRSGRNWPLRDCSEQLRVMNSSTKIAGDLPQGPPRGRQSSIDPTTYPKPMRDPMSPGNPISPAESLRPAPRDLNEIFVNGEEPVHDERSPSPSKRNDMAPKAGAGKHYQPNRLFGENDKPSTFDRPLYKSDPKKYSHFAMGENDGIIQPAKPINPRNNFPSASFEFADFSTPVKQPARKQPQQLRHFGIGESPEVGPTPPGPAARARPDAAAHFDLEHKPTPENEKRRPSKPVDTRDIYEPHISLSDENKLPLQNKNNINSTAPRKDLDSHFSIDQLAINDENVNNQKDNRNGTKSENIKPTIEKIKPSSRMAGLQASFTLFDDTGRDEPGRGIRIAGNGMGNRSGTEWWLQDEQEAEELQKKSAGGIRIQGNGMGNKSGTEWWLQPEEAGKTW